MNNKLFISTCNKCDIVTIDIIFARYVAINGTYAGFENYVSNGFLNGNEAEYKELKREELKTIICSLILQDKKLFPFIVEKLDDIECFACNFRCYPMDQIDNIFQDSTPTEILNAVTPNFDINDKYYIYTYENGYLYSTNDIYSYYKNHINSESFMNCLLNNFKRFEIFEALPKEISNLLSLLEN